MGREREMQKKIPSTNLPLGEMLLKKCYWIIIGEMGGIFNDGS